MAMQSLEMLVLVIFSLSDIDLATGATTPANTTDVPTTTNVAVQNNATTTGAVVTNVALNNSATINSTNYAGTITNDVTTKNVTSDPTAKNNGDSSSNTMSDERIAVIILAAVLGLVLMFVFLAACAWLTSNSIGKHRRYRNRRRRKRYEIEIYASSEPSSHADDIYVPFDGPPEMTSSHKKSSVLEPYYSLPADTKYSPYLFDDDMGQYMKADLNPYRGYDLDRPYFSSTGLRHPLDNYPSDWYRSMPGNFELTLPRPLIR